MNIFNKKEIVDRLKEKGFATGSRVYGIATENSDYDYVILKKDLDDDWIGDILKYDSTDYLNESDFTSFRFSFEGKNYNIIAVNKMAIYDIYYRATKIMTLIPPILKKDKVIRIETFQFLKKLVNERGSYYKYLVSELNKINV